MKVLKPIVFIFFISLFCFNVHAQQNTAADSTSSDSSQQITEAYIIQQKEQQRVDSIITAQLQNELQQADTDSKKKQELEDKLKAISQRDSLRKAEQLKNITALKQTAKGYPVTLLSDTLFKIYTRIGSFSAAERANAVSERIKKLYDDAFFNPDSLKIEQTEVTYDVTYNNGIIIMSVTDFDALWYNKTPTELANDYLNAIRTSVVAEKKSNNLFSWLKRIGYICLIILGIWLIIYGINRLFNYTAKFLSAHRNTYFTGITFKKIKFLSAIQHYMLARRINNFVRLIIIILALYLALPLLFSVFPQTKSFGDTLLNWIITPAKAILNGIIDFLPNLFTIIVIYFATTYLVKFVKYFATEVDKGVITLKGFYHEWAWPTFNIVRFLIYAFMFVIVFPYLPGSQSDAFKGVTVFLGVLFSLGSSSAISNLVAGLVITYMRPFKIGDRVKIGDSIGDVIEKTLLVTRLRTIKNEDITVPNSTVLSNNTINYSANANDIGLIVHTTVTIGYDVPWKDMHQALIDAALRVELISKEPLPFVLQTSLEDFYVSYQINAYTKESNRQAYVYSELHKSIQDVCNERGIEIMSPHYNAMRDGNASTIPPDYLPKDYKPSSFNVNMNRSQNEEK